MQKAELDTRPGGSHRRPKRSNVTYAVRRHLSEWIAGETRASTASALQRHVSSLREAQPGAMFLEYHTVAMEP